MFTICRFKKKRVDAVVGLLAFCTVSLSSIPCCASGISRCRSVNPGGGTRSAIYKNAGALSSLPCLCQIAQEQGWHALKHRAESQTVDSRYKATPSASLCRDLGLFMFAVHHETCLLISVLLLPLRHNALACLTNVSFQSLFPKILQYHGNKGPFLHHLCSFTLKKATCLYSPHCVILCIVSWRYTIKEAWQVTASSESSAAFYMCNKPCFENSGVKYLESSFLQDL